MSFARSPRGRQRAGWTLIELIVVLAVGGLIAAAAARALAARQRDARVAAEIRAMRADLRDAAGVLAGELRGIALQDTLRFAADTAVEFFAPLLSAITCAPPQGPRLLLRLLHATPAAFVAPDTGDMVWVWREDSLLPPGRWLPARLTSFAPVPTESCDEWFSGGSLPAQAVTLTEPLQISSGTPMQFVRRGRYSVYRAADNAWYLGYRRCDAAGPSRCQAVQPVAGPYRPRAGGKSGIQFRYLDSAGTELSGAAALTGTFRIELLVRSDTAAASRRAPRRSALHDSTLYPVAIRNAP